MAKPIQAQNEPGYGDEAMVAQQEAAMAEAQAMAAQAQPTIGETPAAVEPPVSGNPVPTEQPPVPAQSMPGVRIGNPAMLLPPQHNFAAQMQRKTPVEKNYDAGLLFKLLSRDSEEFALISRELMGE